MQEMNQKLDNEFNKIEGLKWLSFVGNEYLELTDNKKVLIVGESHYQDETNESIEKHKDKTFTRKVVDELAINRYYYRTKIFYNFHKTIFVNDKFNSSKFWNLVSFYNFIQRSMTTNKDRPTDKDFINGWKAFFKVIKVVKPKMCILIGVESSNSLKLAMNESEFKLTNFETIKEKFSGTYPRLATIELNDKQIDLIFIQHTGSKYSYGAWHIYLKGVVGEQVEWFRSQADERFELNEN